MQSLIKSTYIILRGTFHSTCFAVSQAKVPSTKSIVLCAATVYAGYYICQRWKGIVACMEIGPYPTKESNRCIMALQRVVMNVTKRRMFVSWFPLDSMVNEKPRRANDNGHPISGSVRDAGRKLIEATITAQGWHKYEISPAKQSAESTGGCAHQHYAPSDLHKDIQAGDPKAHSVIVGIDVDYYINDIGNFMQHAMPLIFHTFNPISVSGNDGDSTFTIKDNVVTYDVSGGSSWKHQVWDWCAFGEFVCTPVKKFHPLNLLGLEKRVYHKVYHSRPWTDCPDRVLVWCIPEFTCWKIKWFKTDLEVRNLMKVDYKDKSKEGYNRICYQNSDGIMMTNFGRAGEMANMTLPLADLEILNAMTSSQSVASRAISMGYKSGAQVAALTQYHAGKDSTTSMTAKIGRPVAPRVHWPAAMEANDAEVSARAYAKPLVSDENLVPMIKRWEVMSQSLERRVTWVHNKRTPSSKIQALALEFVKLIVPDEIAGTGVPYSVEETKEMLSKPSQQLAIARIWETLDMDHRRLIESFPKNEPTMKAPRIISSFPDARFLLKISQFTLRFRDEVLHNERNSLWFCPGKTPSQIADQVCEYVRSIETPMEGDFSNFDGTVSAWCQRQVMNAVYHRYFDKEYAPSLKSYTDMLISCPARAKKFGFRYEAGVGVKSGSPTTCDANTVLNAFIQYCAVRTTDIELEPEMALTQIGLAFGDDSLFANKYRTQFVRTAADLGMKLKVEKYDAAGGVSFLARVFVDPATTRTSFQDPIRTWRKLHITMRDPNIPIATAAVDRVDGYLVIDGLTPVTAAFCSMIRRSYAKEALQDTKRETRISKNNEKPYWLTTGGAWPQEEKDVPAMVEMIAYRTGMTPEKIRDTDRFLQDPSTTPESDFTFNRDETPMEWKDHVTEDGVTNEGEVDNRVFQNDRKINHINASGKVPKVESGIDGTSSSTDGKATGESSGSQGHTSVPRVSDETRVKAGCSNKEPARKASGKRNSAGSDSSSRQHRKGGTGTKSKNNKPGKPAATKQQQPAAPKQQQREKDGRPPKRNGGPSNSH